MYIVYILGFSGLMLEAPLPIKLFPAFYLFYVYI